MKRTYLYLILTALTFAACNDADKKSLDAVKPRSTSTLHSFTDTTKLDTFKLVLKGEKPKNMELIFTITPLGSKAVYTKVIKAKELLDNYKEGLDLGREKKQIKFIEEELVLFFAEENFLDPAVTETEVPDKNTPDKKFFAELKRTGLSGFQYRLGKESKVYIAWSTTERKTMPYYECCK